MEKRELEKPIASLSFDVDDKWSYMKTHGDPGWEKYPSYLDFLIIRVLDFLKERNLTITFFIVGQDAAFEKNQEIFRTIANYGHEIGNHSFKHEPWLHYYSQDEIKSEITMAEEHIEYATGKQPIGFRGPGYSLSSTILNELARRGYLYDATTCPNLLTPFVRFYYFLTANFTPEEKQQRKILGGQFRDGFRPIRPYCWCMDHSSLIEIPVTTMPIFKIPIHISYLLCLSTFSPIFAKHYLNMALKLCRLMRIQPSLLLHPTDFLGCDDIKELSFIPGMDLPKEKKMELVSNFLDIVSHNFRTVTLKQHAYEVKQSCKLSLINQSIHRDAM